MGFDKMRIMPFGSQDGFMAQQLLHGADVGTRGQQLHREGVAEPVRAHACDTGQLAQPVHGFPDVLTASLGIPASRPEKIFRILGRQAHQCIDGIGVQLDLEGHAVFGDAHGQITLRRIQRGAAQNGHIRDAQPAIEKHVQESAGTSPDIGSGRQITGPNTVTGIEKPDDLLCSEWESRDIVRTRFAQSARRIAFDPATIHRETEEIAQMLDFLLHRAWSDGTLLAPTIKHRKINATDFAAGECMLQTRQSALIVREGGVSQIPSARIVHISFDSAAQTDARQRLSRWITRTSRTVRLLEHAETLPRAIPVARIKRLVDALSVEHSVRPYRAVAELIVAALSALRAGFQVAPVGFQHGITIPAHVANASHFSLVEYFRWFEGYTESVTCRKHLVTKATRCTLPWHVKSLKINGLVRANRLCRRFLRHGCDTEPA